VQKNVYLCEPIHLRQMGRQIERQLTIIIRVTKIHNWIHFPNLFTNCYTYKVNTFRIHSNIHTSRSTLISISRLACERLSRRKIYFFGTMFETEQLSWCMYMYESTTQIVYECSNEFLCYI
jgi:hypothetical protein